MQHNHYSSIDLNKHIHAGLIADPSSKTSSLISTNGSQTETPENTKEIARNKAAVLKQSLDEKIRKMKEVCKNARSKKDLGKYSLEEGDKIQGQGAIRLQKSTKLLNYNGETIERKSVEYGLTGSKAEGERIPKFSLPIKKSKNLNTKLPKKAVGSLQHINEVKQSESFVQNESSDNESVQSVVQSKGMSIFSAESRKGNAGEFQILKFLDEGQSGKVYLARSHLNNALYSVKSLYRSKITHKEIEQLIRQVKIQSFLDHPNICKLYNFFVDEECAYMVLEPCMGGNLFQKLKAELELDERTVQDIIRQVCTAVEYMHQHDVLHRDIKAENILLHEGMAKVCDFGWAVHSPILRGTKCGTPVYSAPEMVRNVPYDSKVDIWCIGVLTYELLFGTIPFEIRHQSDMAKIIEEQVYFSKSVDISSAAKDFIMSCMAKNPSERASIKQLLRHDFLLKQEKFRLSMAI